MYEYGGHEYSEQEVQQAAEQNGMSVEEYIKEFGLEAKQEGVAQGEVTPSPVEPPKALQEDMASFSEAYSSASQDIKTFDPSSLGPIVQEQESYMGVPKDGLQVQDDIREAKEMSDKALERQNYIAGNIKRQFEGTKASSKTVKTPSGPVLDYSDENNILDFNANTLSNAIKSDETIQALIESRLDEKKDYIKSGMENLMSQYEGVDPKDFTSEDYDKLNKGYSKLINGIIGSDRKISKEIDAYKKALQGVHNAENSDYIADFTITDHIERGKKEGSILPIYTMEALYNRFPNVYKGAFKGTHGIGTSIKMGGLATSPYLKVERQHERNLERAERENWDENTVGYFNKDGAFIVPSEGGMAPQASGYTQLGTWKEAKDKAKDIIKNGQEEQAFLLQTIFERQGVESAFGQHDIRDVFKAGTSYENIRGIASEQIPQMVSALVSFGTIPAAQMMGDNYMRQVEKEAKLKYDTDQPTIEQLIKTVEDDVDDSMFESASRVGLASGAAEYMGATSVFRATSSSIGKISSITRKQIKETAASLVKGQYKNFLRQQLRNGRTYASSGFDEAITEATQQLVSDISVNNFDYEGYVQGVGAGFLMGFLLPFSGNIASTTAREVSNAYALAHGKLDIKGMREFHAYNLSVLDNQKKSGEITEEVYSKKKQQLEDFMQSSQTFDRGMSDARKSSLMESQFAKADAEDKLMRFRNSEKGEKYKELSKMKREELSVVDTELKEGVITEDKAKEQKRIINTKYNSNSLFKEYNTLAFNYGQKVTDLANNVDFNENLNSTLAAFAELDIVGTNVVVAETNEEFAKKYLESQGIKNPTQELVENKAREYRSTGGVFTSGGKIIINAESSIAKNQATSGSHEVLHAILANTFRSVKDGKQVVNQESLSNVMSALNSHLIELESKGKIKGLDNLRYRIGAYQTFTYKGKKYTGQELATKSVKDGVDLMQMINESTSVQIDPKNVEEIMTLLSDGLLKGEITYNASLFESIGDFIRRLLQSIGLKEIQFNDSRDVFNFVRDYNNSVIKRKSTAAQRKFAQYGGRGKLVDIDKNSVGYKAAQDMESAQDLFSKPDPSPAQKEMSNKVQALYDEKGPESAYDIAELYRPMFRKIVTRGNWDTLPGWENMRLEIEDEALYDTTGLVGIVMTYKPETGVPLAAYINKYFALRASNIKDKYISETFDKNIDDLKGGGPAISEEESMIASIDQRLKEKDAAPEFSVIRRKLGLDPKEMNIVRAIVTRTLSLSPDLVSTKKWKPSLFRTFLNEAYKTQIYKTVLEKFPTRSKDFQLWAKTNKSWIEREISLNTLRKFPALNGVLYEFQKDANGKVMRYSTEESVKLGIKDPYSGVKKIVRKFPTDKEWADYLDPTRIGRSRNMPHEHKRVLAEAVSIELGMDATLETMQNPNQQLYDLDGMPIEGREINMYERIVENNADVVEENQIIGRVAFILDRDPTVKFSKAALDAGMAGERMSELIMANPEPILKAFRDTIAPYRLMVPFKRDNTSGQLKIAMANTLVNAFRSNYPWLNENSARVISNQLASDFAAIARRIDIVKMQVHEQAEAEFINALSDRLFTIAENNVLNQGHRAVLGQDTKSIPPSLTRQVLEKVFNSPRASRKIMPWLMNEETSLLNEDFKAADLQYDIAEGLMKIKRLYANGHITRDEVGLIFDKVFTDQGSKKALIKYAAPVGLRMVGIKANNMQNMFSIPIPYLSGYLANIAVNPRKKAEDMLVIGDLMVVQATKKYIDKIVRKQGKGMPHFRNDIAPNFLSRISRVTVGSEGTSKMFEVLKNNALHDAMNIDANGDIVFDDSIPSLEQTADQSVLGLIDHSALVSLDYNGKTAQNIQNLMGNNDKFSKQLDEDGDAIRKKKKIKELEDNLQNILDEIQQSGTVGEDAIKLAEIEEQQRLNDLAADIDKQFNDILEEVTGVDADTEYSKVASQHIGRGKNEAIFFVPPSHDDFKGLIENYLVGKGKEQSQKHRSFFEEYLYEPYYEGVNNYSAERVRMIRQYRDVKTTFKPLFKNFKQEAFPGMSIENAIRVYIWSRKGYDIPGVSEADIKQAKSFVVKNGLAREAAIEIMKITDLHGHVEPSENWTGNGIIGDIIDSLKKNSRKKYLEEWNQNVDFIFNEKNKNKLRAQFGQSYVSALDNIITRMQTGRNRLDGKNSGLMNWLNGAVGVVMFANMRSAALQLISFTNYIEATGVNNVFNAFKAFANQNQFWSDVKYLMNSDYMRERREGLKIDINEAELAESAKNSKNWWSAALSWFLSKGFTPTQIADSLAIVLGGAPYFRNYVNNYMQQGLTEEEAMSSAFIDFRNKTEDSQQSSRPDRIGSQQASISGRMMLTFANTQSQYDRIIKKEYNNLKNKRGNAANSIARIAYYGMAQNALFISLQGALLGAILGFDDDDEEGINSSEFKLINGILDSLLRGAGIAGHVASVVKNVGVEVVDRNGRPNPDFEMLAFEAANLVPAVGSKFNKSKSMGYYLNKVEEFPSLYMFADTNFYKATAMAASAAANIPVDRLLQKYENLANAIDVEGEFETYQQILMALGWPDYQLGIDTKPTNKTRSRSRSKGRSRSRSRSRSRKR